MNEERDREWLERELMEMIIMTNNMINKIQMIYRNDYKWNLKELRFIQWYYSFSFKIIQITYLSHSEFKCVLLLNNSWE